MARVAVNSTPNDVLVRTDAVQKVHRAQARGGLHQFPAAAGGEVGNLETLNGPASGAEQAVDSLASALLRVHSRRMAGATGRSLRTKGAVSHASLRFGRDAEPSDAPLSTNVGKSHLLCPVVASTLAEISLRVAPYMRCRASKFLSRPCSINQEVRPLHAKPSPSKETELVKFSYETDKLIETPCHSRKTTWWTGIIPRRRRVGST